MKAFEVDTFSPLTARRENGQAVTVLKLRTKLPQRRSLWALEVWRLSESRDQISNPQLQGFGDSLERFQRNLLLCAFDFANVVAIQVGFLGQFFLAESGSLAFDADRFTDDPVKLLRRHHNVLPNQEALKRATGYEPLFFCGLSLTLPGDGVKSGFSSKGQLARSKRVFARNQRKFATGVLVSGTD